MTALHCLVRGKVPEMHLLLGYDRGQWREHLQPDRAASTDAARDIATLCLGKTSTARPVPLATRPPKRGETVLVVGYGKPRVQIANRKTCRVTATGKNGAFQLDCPVTRGTSGAPVLRKTGTGHEMLGILSATSKSRSLAYRVRKTDGAASCESTKRAK